MLHMLKVTNYPSLNPHSDFDNMVYCACIHDHTHNLHDNEATGPQGQTTYWSQVYFYFYLPSSIRFVKKNTVAVNTTWFTHQSILTISTQYWQTTPSNSHNSSSTPSCLHLATHQHSSLSTSNALPSCPNQQFNAQSHVNGTLTLLATDHIRNSTNLCHHTPTWATLSCKTLDHTSVVALHSNVQSGFTFLWNSSQPVSFCGTNPMPGAAGHYSPC